MKFLLAVCIALCFAGVFCDEAPKPEEMIYFTECAKNNNLDDKMIGDLKKSKSFTMNQNTMCFVQCAMEHKGMMDAEGKMTEKFMTAPHAEDCKAMTGKDKCETAAKVMDCMFSKNNIMMSNLNL